MQSLLGPILVGQRRYEPTCALLVGPFSCYCVCGTGLAFDEGEVQTSEHAAQSEVLDSISPMPKPQKSTLQDEPQASTDPLESDASPATTKLAEALGIASPRLLDARYGRSRRETCGVDTVIRSVSLEALPLMADATQQPQTLFTSRSAPQDGFLGRSYCLERAVSEGGPSGQRTIMRTINRFSSYARAILFAKHLGGHAARKGSRFEAELIQYLQDSRPPAMERLAELGWEDYCTERYELYVKWLSSPPRIMQSVKTRTDRMAECLPAVQMEDGNIRGGLFPILFTASAFPSWLSIVQSVTVLKQLSPLRRICLCSMKIGFFSFDIVVFVAVVNRLDSTGTIDLILKSPEPDSEGQEWFGITVPQRTARVRMSLKAYGISYRPVSKDHGCIESQMEISDSFPLKRVAVLLIKTGNDKFLPHLEKVNQTFRGSAIEETLNGDSQEAQETRGAFARLSRSVDEFLARQA
mmetsp:Transcript_34633/g.99512  ORF Transcript_34633/g.99512 Transcript_34633/m.99512 type:complete len:468 (-) Transcript_34633:27-1430(-)